jgi:hypothetical protein
MPLKLTIRTYEPHSGDSASTVASQRGHIGIDGNVEVADKQDIIAADDISSLLKDLNATVQLLRKTLL